MAKWYYIAQYYCNVSYSIQQNKKKRLVWSKEQLRTKEEFKDVIFTDETTVQLEQHSKICFRKRLQPRQLKQRAKHPIKIHVWGGISLWGATKVIMFTGIMNAERLRVILEAGLLPFIQEQFSDGHRLYQDNDPSMPANLLKIFSKSTMSIGGPPHLNPQT